MKSRIRKLNSSHLDPADRPVRLVVAALILRGVGESREVLICQRRQDQPMALKWEFPGGKIEPGEAATVALARELEEELGIQATIGPPVTAVRHKYRNGSSIQIQFFEVYEYGGRLENRIFKDMLWTPLSRLPEYDFLAADLQLIRELAAGKLL